VSGVRVVSVNVSPGRVVTWQGQPITTGIFKEPVEERVRIRETGLDGDRQADRTVHGGPFKAVYAYSLEHYHWWQEQLRMELYPGSFGENLTIRDFPEDQIAVGDVFQLGRARLQAVQPRLPCFKLGIRFGTQRVVKQFMQSGRFGIYFRVLEEGDVGAGDALTWLHRDPRRVPVASLVRLLQPATFDRALAESAAELPSLPPEWRELLTERAGLAGMR
jgi:MOSC domain-containing protein YiiM